MNKIIEQDLKEIISSDIINWNKFNNTTILITGANGMLPSYLVYTLMYLNINRNSNIHIVALVRNKQKGETKFAEFMNNDLFELKVQNVTQEISLQGNLDYIIHAASQASPKYYGVDPVGTITANVEGTINVLKLATEKKCKSVLYFSSGEVYGIIPSDQMPIVENNYGYVDPTKVRSCYAESKRMGENLCVSWAYQYGLNIKIVRPFHTYGPGMTLNDGRVFADFCKNIIQNEDIILRSDGSAMRSFCYISDATLAYFKVLLDGNKSEAYNVGNPTCEISIKDLATLLINLYPPKKLQVKFNIDKNDMRTGKMKSPLYRNTPNISKINELKWKPKISLKDGFKRVIESFK